jgi:hypothetical protein
MRANKSLEYQYTRPKFFEKCSGDFKQTYMTFKGALSFKDGDCLVCFDKRSIFRVIKNIKAETGRDCAVIFGDLPPSTKLAQTAKFNNPADPCFFVKLHFDNKK